MRKFRSILLPVALLAAPVALAAAPKPAHPPMHMPMQPPAAASAPKIKSATMHKFASAFEQVRQVRGKYMIKIQSAKTAKQKTALKKQAVKEMKHDISTHMPLPQYVKVAKAIKTNPAERKRLIKILQADSKKPSTPQHH